MIQFENSAYLWLLLLTPLIVVMIRYSLLQFSKPLQLICASLRIGILALLILAMAGTLWVSKSQDLSLLILADSSDSVPEDALDSVQAFRESLEAIKPENTQIAIAQFNSSNVINQPLTDNFQTIDKLEPLQGGGDATSLENALSFSRQLLPTTTLNRVILFTDGNETQGDVMTLAKRIHSLKVFPKPYPKAKRNEILLEDLQLPAEVMKGQSFSINTVVHSTQETDVQFTLYRNGFKAQDKTISLKAGANTLTFQENNPEEGLLKYQLTLTVNRAEDDFFTDNNTASGLVHVAGEPKILLLENSEKEARYLARALMAENINIEVREAHGMPATLDELVNFDAIILSDVPATEVSNHQMHLLRSYVEDLGGGFLMLGGENSFGLGGYYRTAIEDILPLRMRAERKKETPSLAMMLVIDKSGSMGSESKMDLAKEAAIAAVELLDAKDYVGVVAFDGSAYPAVEIQSAANQSGIISSIANIQAGGGTNIYPALDDAYQSISMMPAALKHTILLTDGHSQPGDFEYIVDQMSADKITVSTIAVGNGADTNLLEDIARWGRGRFYYTDDPQSIPQIFTKETMTASKSSMIEEPFVPQVLRNSPAISSIAWKNAPFLFGYISTTAKPTAHIPLITERGDPLLATWQVGLGKSAAFTSDAKTRWAADWLNWPGYSQFWTQLIRYIMRSQNNRGASTSITYSGSKAYITVDAYNNASQFVNALDTQLQIIQPNLTTTPMTLQQTAPGRYQGEFPINQTGSYLVKMNQIQSSNNTQEIYASSTRGYTLSYHPEYRHLDTNVALLEQLANITGGSYDASLEEILHIDESEQALIRKRIWPWLLSLALILFALDVTLRRLEIAGRGIFKPTAIRYG